ncbi:hypothetical protein [Sanguibacter sp. 25GB23B1]|uniref:hypothetical protein n=1 Tax=unclassified Sanguibacter TaxID=2645534 RepID=UPI0032AF9B81
MVLLLVGALLLSGWTTSVAIGIMGVSVLGLLVLAIVITVLRERHLRAPDPEVSTRRDTPATLIRRERVAFLMGVLILWDLVLISAVWAGLVASESLLFALFLGLPVLWSAWFTALVLLGRFDAGGIWFTPDRLVYVSRGLRLEIRWRDISSVDGGKIAGMVLVSSEDPTAFTYTNVPALWRSERMASPTMAVIRTDDMSVDPGTLARFLGRYALTPAARSELGTPASLEALEAVRLTTSSGPLPNAFTRRRPEGSGA